MTEQQRITENIKAVVTAYRAVRPIAISTVSRIFFGDGKFLDDRIFAAKPGGSFTVAMIDSGLRKLSKEWPDGAEWPPAVERPPLRPARRAG